MVNIFYFSVTTSSWTFTDVKYCLFDGDEQGLPSFAVQNSRNPWKQFGCGSNHKWITSRSIRCLGRKDCIRISTWTTQVIWWWVIWKKSRHFFLKNASLRKNTFVIWWWVRKTQQGMDTCVQYDWGHVEEGRGMTSESLNLSCFKFMFVKLYLLCWSRVDTKLIGKEKQHSWWNENLSIIHIIGIYSSHVFALQVHI